MQSPQWTQSSVREYSLKRSLKDWRPADAAALDSADMVSSHFPFTYGHEWGWAILGGLILVGAAIRHWFNLRGQGHRNAWLMPLAALGMIVLAVITLPASSAAPVATDVSFDEGVAIIQSRCVSCHSDTPTQPGFTAPPKDVVFTAGKKR